MIDALDGSSTYGLHISDASQPIRSVTPVRPTTPRCPFKVRAASAGAMCLLQPQGEDCEAGWTAPLMNRMSRGIPDAVLFLSAASVVRAMRRWMRAPRRD